MTYDYTIRQKQRLHRFRALPLGTQGEKAAGISRGVFYGARRRVRASVRVFMPPRLTARANPRAKAVLT